MSKIYILLPVHNRKYITQKFIRCLCAQTFKKYHLVLIDDGSTDGTEGMVRSFIDGPQLTVIKGDGDLWWAGSLNKGFLWLKKNVIEGNVLIINDDTIIENDFISKGIELLNKSKNCIYLAKAISIQDKKKTTAGIQINWRDLTFNMEKKLADINCFSTRGLFLKVKDFLNIGGFHPILLPHYLSDYEYTNRAFRKGYKLVVNDSLFLKYDEESTGIRTINSPNKADYFKQYFSKKNAGNPIYFMSFVLLAAPYKYKLKHLVKISLSTVKNCIKKTILL